MSVELMFHTQLSDKFKAKLQKASDQLTDMTDGKILALTAIRTCYSANKPSEIAIKEGAKYFGSAASDGTSGSDADRLIRQIVASKHTSTLEGITFTFAIEGVSRALLAQLTRHRVGFSFSVQSQRYVRMGSGDRSGGFDYVVPEKVMGDKTAVECADYDLTAEDVFDDAMKYAQESYDLLRKAGVPAEDARAVLPQAAATNLVLTVNLRALLDFYAKRRKGNGAQAEIADLAEALRREVVEVEPWTAQFFEGVSASV
ncbi:FAD-dependent thymidylate synthase [Bacillus pumilus]|uniref:FAD-dependent thymidylate synthase n=1 Tax=Bacillus pumilus TaxID=1408 RepID=UPI0005554C13|nr:FAD-dependent thymidylate synthase [Bacillus pumilus]MCR4352179.1 FAD-dependent thymidylate synthase [Bacillus pumilus]MCY7503990.1 FAD-dependent thymidylate synthase [Bacillus pumilus]MDR4269017.1 FAD-dependent thymidylate synthase [Bacillus pumilus]MDR4269104.1 FAD-dependent thymidylate synthase [Bacillus pumilus]MED4724275.1 FAD-dependent thymidylate synthase [Bacillus pumilus]